jgi:hypothetical protein
MIDIARSDYPPDMLKAAHHPAGGTLDAMTHDVMESIEHFIRGKPITAALCAFGVGLFLGWKLRG